MERLPAPSIDIKDTNVRRFLLELLKALTNVSESALYSVEVAWSEPMNLSVPFRSGGVRKNSPAIVRLANASLSAAPELPVSYGATKWKWNGDGSVKIIHVEGLTAGTRYQLTFEVVG
jgi:hypothetical protein